MAFSEIKAPVIKVLLRPCDDEWKVDYASYESSHRGFHGTKAYVEKFFPGEQIWALEIYRQALKSERCELESTLLFRLNGLTAEVFSQFFAFDREIIDNICDEIFRIFPDVGIIEFVYLVGWATDARLRYPARERAKSASHVLKLPNVITEFEQCIPQKYNKKFLYYYRRFFREFPLASFRIIEGNEISRAEFMKIILLSRMRANKKGLVSGIDEIYADRIFDLVKHDGFIFLLKIGDEICSGDIVMQQNGAAYLWVIGHDPKYDKYSPGVISLYLGIRDCCVRGFSEFNFLWGDSKYKREFGAVSEGLTSIIVARNRLYLACGMIQNHLLRLRRVITQIRRKSIGRLFERLFNV